MAYDYGYGELENQLIELFRSGAPDFDTAEKLLGQGANLNATGTKEDENILSEILMGYWDSSCVMSDACDECLEEQCEGCVHCVDLNPNLGQSMCKIIYFFLNHGFDVRNCDGRSGAQCLYALTLSTFDRYMIEAAKILLDAGARNQSIAPNETDDNDTPWDFIATEASYHGSSEHNYALANIYEAVYQIYQAVDEGRPYNGIDFYENAVGKKY